MAAKGGYFIHIYLNMKTDRLSASLRVVLASLLSLQTVAVVAAASIARAEVPTPNKLVINEINWAGSTGNPMDQWVEFFNPNTVGINLHDDAYTFSLNGVVEDTGTALSSGIIPPHGTLVLSRLDVTDPSAHSTLSATSGAKHEQNLNLPTTNAQYTLTEVVGGYTDIAGLPTGAPFAGSDGTSGSMIVASESRVFAPNGVFADGTVASSWYTPTTIGGNFASDQVQYGTPGTINGEEDVPTNIVITPSTPVNNNPTVTANFGGDSFGAVNFTNVATHAVIKGFGTVLGGFKPVTLLPVGTYNVTVSAIDGLNGNRSAYATASTQVIVIPDHNTITAPTAVDATQYTNQSTTTVTGTMQAGVAAVVATNGAITVTQPVGPTDSTYSIVVPLTADAINTITVQAKATDGGLSTPSNQVKVTEDNIAPRAITRTKVDVFSNPAGTNDSLLGQFGAAEFPPLTEPYGTVSAYADAALTQLIKTVQVNADGSFPSINLGDNQYDTVYLVQTDIAGNTSPALKVVNAISFVSQNINIPITVSNITQTGATVSWNAVTGAADYVVKFKSATGNYTSPVMVCGSTTPCVLQRAIIGLSSGTSYTVAVAAVDQYGNQSNYSTASFQTTGPVVVTPPTITTTTATDTTATPTPTTTPAVKHTPTPSATVTPTPTATATVSPTPSASPTENGEVKSSETSSRNWTPWIILGILIGLAILATAGYFYWFGGETEDDSTPTPPVADKSDKKSDREKRW